MSAHWRSACEYSKTRAEGGPFSHIHGHIFLCHTRLLEGYQGHAERLYSLKGSAYSMTGVRC